MIPADDSETYYPTDNSWYNVKEGKIYAYIELQNKTELYGYCYNGTIDKNYEGKCLYEEAS